MRHLLGLPNMEECHKLAQVKAFLKICADPKHPLHGKIGRRVESRLTRGTEWMTQAAQTIEECGLSVEAIMRGCSQFNFELFATTLLTVCFQIKI